MCNLFKKHPDNKEPMATLPPGQKITAKLPIFSYGKTPLISLNEWRLQIDGLVKTKKTLEWVNFLELPQTTVTADFHCVTRWSRLNNVWKGVLFKDVATLVKPLEQARFVIIHCYGGYLTNLPLNILLEKDVILATQLDGHDLHSDHGWPLRLIVPSRYGWKSAKWIAHLEFVQQDVPGFWENRGYNNNADPWKEDRFWPEIF